jgi:hypothetical protein
MAKRKVISNLHTRVTASSEAFEAAMTRANKSLDRFVRKNRDTIQELKRVGQAAAAAAALVSAAMVKMTVNGLRNVDALAKQADTLGLTTDQLLAYQRMASRAGIEPEKFSKNLERMIVNLSKSGSQSGQVAQSLAKLGLKLEDVQSLGTDATLKLLAERMTGVASETEKVRIAYDLFGKEGIRMLRILKDGADGLAKAEARARELGLTISRFDAAKVEVANDAFNDVRLVIDALQNKLAVQFAPLLTGISELLVDQRDKVDGVVQAFRLMADVGVTGIGMVSDSVFGLNTIFRTTNAVAMTMFSNIVGGAASAYEGMWKVLTLGGTLQKPRSFSWQGYNPWEKREKPEEKPSDIRVLAQEAAEEAAKAWAQVDELIDKPLPSDSINNWYGNLIEKNKMLADESLKTKDGLDAAKLAIDEMAAGAGENAVKVNEFALTLAESIGQGLENAAAQGKLSMRDFAKFVISQLQAVMVKALIVGPLLRSLGMAFGGQTSSIGAAFLKAGGVPIDGGKAIGGAVNTGRQYIVGERGPELFVPNQGGKIVPNGAGGGSVTYNIDARGADAGAVARIEQALQRVNASIEPRSVQANINWRSRRVLA